ncbi:MAG: cytochrome c family protein [Candidatus Electryonea clarkiae]|nr:cytochrome c family protein [Candidatus Electryonea clarkiae]MDP8287332.1 cytochrome c family protein [Candidatus Electryonea clarkiae]
MRRIILSVLAVTFLMSVVSFASDHAYVGLKKCKMCHKGETKGMIFEKWQESKHAQAFDVLAAPAAAEVYTKLGKTGNPQEDVECLKCHVTGADADTSLTAKIIFDNGVTCESCHGAGGAYWKKTVMQDHDAAVAAGMNPDPKSGCVTCHNENSPTFKDFNFEARWEDIKHSKPE